MICQHCFKTRAQEGEYLCLSCILNKKDIENDVQEQDDWDKFARENKVKLSDLN